MPLDSKLRHRTVPLRNAIRLIERMGAFGHPASELWLMVGVSKTAAAVEGYRVSAERLVALYQAIVDSKPGDDFFLRGADRFTLADYGILGYAMMSAADVGKAINIAMKYYETAGPLCEMSFRTENGNAFLEVHNSFRLTHAVFRSVVEDLVSGFRPLLTQLTGRRIDPLWLDLAFGSPADPEVHRRYLGTDLRYNAPLTRYVLPEAALALPVLQANEDAAQLLERSCQSLLEEIAASSTVSNQLRQKLLARGVTMSAADAARELNLSERTLRRRLSSEGTSFQMLLDQVRLRLAEDYLRSTDLSVQQIGELLGFTEATNFRRAFVRWSGRSPKQMRTFLRGLHA